MTRWEGNGSTRVLKFRGAVVRRMKVGVFGFDKKDFYDEPLVAVLKKKARGNPDWNLTCQEIGISWVTITGRNWQEAKANALARLLDRVHDRLQMYYNLFIELTS